MCAQVNLKAPSAVCLLLLLLVGCQRSRSPNNLAVMSKPKGEEARQEQPANETSIVRVQQTELKLLPIDEASQDPSFEKFRNKLVAAAKDHDANSILSVLDPHILNSFGGSGGIKEFRAQWKLDEPRSEFWNTLITVLRMGGSFSNNEGKKEFCAPYVSSKWQDIISRLPTNSDPLEYVAITNNDVEVRAEPNMNSSIVGTLSYDVVKVVSDRRSRIEINEEDSKWVKIMTLHGTVGYIAAENTRSPSDYHACFKKVGSGWLMTALAAGD